MPDLQTGPEDDAMLMSHYKHQDFVTLQCVCGCGRAADTFRSDDGLATYCRDLRWYKAQRANA